MVRYPAIFGPQSVGQAFGNNVNAQGPILGQQQTMSAATNDETKPGSYGTRIHDPMMDGTMVPPVVYPRYQVAYLVYYIMQRIHRIPLNGYGGITKCQPLAHMKLCTTYD